MLCLSALRRMLIIAVNYEDFWGFKISDELKFIGGYFLENEK